MRVEDAPIIDGARTKIHGRLDHDPDQLALFNLIQFWTSTCPEVLILSDSLGGSYDGNDFTFLCLLSPHNWSGRSSHSGGTMELELSAEERELLLRILDQRHLELQKEISHTDHREFKEVLRKNEKLIESVLN